MASGIASRPCKDWFHGNCVHVLGDGGDGGQLQEEGTQHGPALDGPGERQGDVDRAPQDTFVGRRGRGGGGQQSINKQFPSGGGGGLYQVFQNSFNKISYRRGGGRGGQRNKQFPRSGGGGGGVQHPGRLTLYVQDETSTVQWADYYRSMGRNIGGGSGGQSALPHSSRWADYYSSSSNGVMRLYRVFQNSFNKISPGRSGGRQNMNGQFPSGGSGGGRGGQQNLNRQNSAHKSYGGGGRVGQQDMNRQNNTNKSNGGGGRRRRRWANKFESSMSNTGGGGGQQNMNRQFLGGGGRLRRRRWANRPVFARHVIYI